jgi:hypothetical protein
MFEKYLVIFILFGGEILHDNIECVDVNGFIGDHQLLV